MRVIERPAGSSGECVVIEVKEKHSGIVIGRGGATLKKVMRESGARVDVSKEARSGDPNWREVRITGAQECVEYARCLVEEVLHTANLMDGEAEGSKQVIVELPEQQAAPLLFKQAEALKQIGRQTRTWIRSAKDEHRGQRIFTIFGTGEDDCAEAQHLLQSYVFGGSDQNGQSTRTILVPSDQVGSLIGKGGENIMELQTKYGCSIRVPKAKDGASFKEDRLVSLVGLAERVEAAIAGIEEFLRRHNERGQRGPPPKEGPVQENIFIDELALDHRREHWSAQEDGALSDAELFVRGLPAQCSEPELFDYLCSAGARDVQEILLLKRCGRSKRAAYIMFASHASALHARRSLHGVPAAALLRDKTAGTEGGDDGKSKQNEGRLSCWFSESERCAKGAQSVYRQSILGLLLGTKGSNMSSIKEEAGAQDVHLTGANMKSFGAVDEEPRLHLVVTYEVGGPDGVGVGAEEPGQDSPAAKAIRLWEGQIVRLHEELVGKRKRPQEFATRGKTAEQQAAPVPSVEDDGEGNAGAENEEPPQLEVSVALRVPTSGKCHEECYTGLYVEMGEHNTRPVLRKVLDSGDAQEEQEPMPGNEVFLYYVLPEPDEPTATSGWRIGPELDGDLVFARCSGDGRQPPTSGWELLEPGALEAEGVELLVRLGSGGPEDDRRQRKRRRGGERRRKHRPEGEKPPGSSPQDQHSARGLPAQAPRPPQPPGHFGGPPPPGPGGPWAQCWYPPQPWGHAVPPMHMGAQQPMGGPPQAQAMPMHGLPPHWPAPAGPASADPGRNTHERSRKR